MKFAEAMAELHANPNAVGDSGTDKYRMVDGVLKYHKVWEGRTDKCSLASWEIAGNWTVTLPTPEPKWFEVTPAQFLDWYRKHTPDGSKYRSENLTYSAMCTYDMMIAYLMSGYHKKPFEIPYKDRHEVLDNLNQQS